jgi:hypothetical protein
MFWLSVLFAAFSVSLYAQWVGHTLRHLPRFSPSIPQTGGITTCTTPGDPGPVGGHQQAIKDSSFCSRK